MLLSKIYKWKDLALGLVLALLLPALSWAFEPNTLVLQKPGLSPVRLVIPKQLAMIDRSLAGKGPLVLHVQDLHCNYEVQTNIARLIDYCARDYGLRLVLIEGASQPVNVTKLSSFPSPEIRRSVGRHLLRLGKISGPEYYAAAGAFPIRLEGVEDQASYQASRDCLNTFFNDETAGCLADLRQALEALKPRMYSPQLAMLDHIQSQQHDGSLSWFQYCRQLQGFAQRLSCPLDSYHQLANYLQSGRPEILPELQAEQLLRETTILERALRQRLYQEPGERQLDEMLDRMDRLENLLTISATEEDLQTILAHPVDYQVATFAAFLQEHPGRESLDESVLRLDRDARQALHFYDLADRRSAAFVDHTMAILRSQPQGSVVLLVTGGYHTPAILEKLSRAHIPCLTVKPRFQDLEAENPYFARLKNPATPLEKALARSRGFLAPPPGFAPHPDPSVILDERSLSEDYREAYDLVQTLLHAAKLSDCLSRNWWGIRRIQINQLQKAFEQAFAAYPANSRRFAPDFRHARIQGQALSVPLTVPETKDRSRQPLIVITPDNVQLNLPSSLDEMKTEGFLASFYPAAMRKDIEKSLAARARQLGLKNLQENLRAFPRQAFSMLASRSAAGASRIRALFAPLKRLADRHRKTNSPPAMVAPSRTAAPRFMLLTVYKELLGDFKLALGVLPLLYGLNAANTGWPWMLGISMAIVLAIGVSTLLANVLLGKLERGRVFTVREAAHHIRQEFVSIRANLRQSYLDFFKYKRFHPKASWLAVGLIVAARLFDYATVVAKLSTLHAIVPFVVAGLIMVILSASLLRTHSKTEWLETIVTKSLQIVAAVLIVEMIKFPLGFVFIAALGTNPLTDRLTSVVLRTLKKIVGALSVSSFFLTVTDWVRMRSQRQKDARWKTSPSEAPAKPAWREWVGESLAPGQPVRHITILLLFAGMIFVSLQFSLALPIAAVLQAVSSLGMFLQWRNILHNPQISQKVKVMTLASLLPVLITVGTVSAGLGLLAIHQVWPQFLSAFLSAIAPHLQSGLVMARTSFLPLVSFFAFIYTLLSFSSVLKDQDKIQKLAEAAPERVQILDLMANAYLQRCRQMLTPGDRVDPGLLQAACESGRIKLVSRKMQAEWMVDLLKPGVFSMGKDIYFRRRLFNLLSDQSAAVMIFRERLRQTGLPAERVDALVKSITGRDIAKMDSLVALILKTDHEDESRAALELELGEDYRDQAKRAAYQREALERRYGFTFPVARGSYPREFGSSFHSLNIKIKILTRHGLVPHPFFFRYSAERIEEAAAYCEKQMKNGRTENLKLIQEALALSGQPVYPGVPFFQRPLGWAMRLTLLLPGLLRRPFERFWLRFFQPLYVQAILPQPSRLAIGLADRQSTVGQALASWAKRPGSNHLRILLEALASSLEAIKKPAEKQTSLRQFSVLSEKISLWKGQEAGHWEQANQAMPVFVPGVLAEPGFQGVAGRIAELLKQQPGLSLNNQVLKKNRGRLHRWCNQSV